VTEHDPVKFANGLSAKLATRSRHVCVFLGAGASKASGLPDVAALEHKILESLDGDKQTAFEAELTGRNLEQTLSRLRQIAALVDGAETVDGLTREAAEALDAEVCRLLVSFLGIDNADLAPALQFAAWVARADYRLPVEVFTVNYDLLLETAFERLGVAYFDGFAGSLRARFRTDLVEATHADDAVWLPSFIARLWKLHGSVNWIRDTVGDQSAIVRIGAPAVDGSPAAIYPSDTKYVDSRRVPFVVLHDRLRRALTEPETLVLIAGYSWGDQDLNEIFFEAATRRQRSEFLAFCYSTIPDVLAEHATSTPNLQALAGDEAVLGGLRAKWGPPDPVPAEDIWYDGKLALHDYRNLATFLARSSPPRGELEARLAKALAAAES
jgi:SIR2-like domain